MSFKSLYSRSQLVFCLVLVQCAYSCKGSDTEDTIKCIKIRFVAPLPPDTESGGANILVDSALVFYYKDYTIYKTPYESTATIISIDHAGNYLGERSAVRIAYSYFAYKNTDSVGNKYDSANAIQGHPVVVDSFLYKYGFKSFVLPSDYRAYYNLTDSSENGEQLLLQYAARNSHDVSSNDSLYLYYSNKFKDTPFSLSAASDAPITKKLYRMRLLYNKKFDKEHNTETPKSEISISMEQADIQEHPEIPTLFKKYISQNR